MVAPIVTHKLLQNAIATSNINLVKKILKANHLPADYPNPEDGRPLFFHAIEYQQQHILEYLIDELKDAAYIHKDFKGNTAIITSIASRNHPSFVVCLQRYPESIHARNDDGMTALLLATKSGQVEMVRALLNAG
jgi:ankyrin repeat protein